MKKLIVLILLTLTCIPSFSQKYDRTAIDKMIFELDGKTTVKSNLKLELIHNYDENLILVIDYYKNIIMKFEIDSYDKVGENDYRYLYKGIGDLTDIEGHIKTIQFGMTLEKDGSGMTYVFKETSGDRIIITIKF